MSEAFADTFYWLAVVNPRDPSHSRAVSLELPDRLVTTWPVQMEVMDALSFRTNRPLAVEFWELCKTNPDIVVVDYAGKLLEDAIELFSNRPDKDWSLTDCISFIVMKERGINDALTADHHFEEAGFRILLK